MLTEYWYTNQHIHAGRGRPVGTQPRPINLRDQRLNAAPGFSNPGDRPLSPLQQEVLIEPYQLDLDGHWRWRGPPLAHQPLGVAGLQGRACQPGLARPKLFKPPCPGRRGAAEAAKTPKNAKK